MDIASSAEKISSDGFKIGALVADGTKLALDLGSFASSIYQNAIKNYLQGTGAYSGFGSRPNCDTKFNGTITVLNPTHAAVDAKGNVVSNAGGVPAGQPGLIIQSGDAYIGGNINSGGNLNVSGTVTASMMNAAQGISAHGGAMTLGNPDLTSYQLGISIGGGSIAGADYGGAQARTGDVSAIAVGNGANAAAVNSTAIGTGAQALAANSTAIGPNATVAAGAGPGSFAGGTSTVLGGEGAVAIGNLNQANGNGAVAIGDPQHCERYGSRRRRRQQ